MTGWCEISEGSSGLKEKTIRAQFLFFDSKDASSIDQI